MANLVPDGVRDPAHCATLTARVIKKGIGNILKHASAWYGPSSLYIELCKHLKSTSTTSDFAYNSSVIDSSHLNATRILRQKDDDLLQMSTEDVVDAIRALTQKTIQSLDDDELSVVTQKHLANALFRWSTAIGC